jgi:hypothetical protein
MYKALAEAWYWDPERVSALTPQQVIHLSGEKGGGGGGGAIKISAADLDYYREQWLKANSEEALLRKAERLLARHRARNG